MEILHAAEFLAEYLCHNSHAQSFGQVVRVKVHLKKTDYLKRIYINFDIRVKGCFPKVSELISLGTLYVHLDD